MAVPNVLAQQVQRRVRAQIAPVTPDPVTGTLPPDQAATRPAPAPPGPAASSGPSAPPNPPPEPPVDPLYPAYPPPDLPVDPKLPANPPPEPPVNPLYPAYPPPELPIDPKLPAYGQNQPPSAPPAFDPMTAPQVAGAPATPKATTGGQWKYTHPGVPFPGSTPSGTTPPGSAGTWTTADGKTADPAGTPGWWKASDPQGSITQLLAGRAPSSATLQSLGPQLSAVGIQLGAPNAEGIISKINIPGQGWVRVLDGARQDQGGAGTGWTYIGESGPSSGGNATAGTATPGPVTNPFLDQVRAMLMQRLTADQQPVDENAANIKAPLDAARLEGDRSQQTIRKALAERLYAQGGGQGVNDGELAQGVTQSQEKQGTALSGLRAQLITQEYQARRADMSDALQQALASGDAEMARTIQQQLALLDAQIRREGYYNQRDIVAAQLNAQAGGL